MFNFFRSFLKENNKYKYKETKEFELLSKEIMRKLDLLDKTNSYIQFVSKAELDLLKLRKGLDKYYIFIDTPISNYYNELLKSTKLILSKVDEKLNESQQTVLTEKIENKEHKFKLLSS